MPNLVNCFSNSFYFLFTNAKAANSKNPDTIIETEEASTEEQPSILPQNDRPSKVGS